MKFCGRLHELKRALCPAWGKRCNKCKQENHFASKCTAKSVRSMENEDDEEVYCVYNVSTLKQLPDDQLVTLKVESGNMVRFQVDTGADCNVIPTSIYKKTTKDWNLKNVPLQSHQFSLTAIRTSPFEGEWGYALLGDRKCAALTAMLWMERRPILGRRASIGMKLV